MNLGVGAYRDDNEKPYVFKVVRKVDLEIANDAKLDKEYIPIDGDANMVSLSQKMMFGENSIAIKE